MGFKNTAEVKDKHKRVINALYAETGRLLAVAGNQAVRQAKRNPGFQSRSGNTLASLYYSTRPGKAAYVMYFGAASLVARYQDEGTGLWGPKKEKYAITGNPALKFQFEDGTWFIGRKVMHPGVKPTYFLQQAADAATLYLDTRIPQAAKKALRA